MVARPSPAFSGRRILCASADPAQRRTLVRALAGPGVTVECVRDGHQVLACWAKHPACDVVLMAHALPGLSGLALVRRLRRAGFDGRIIVTCASASAATVAAYRALGVAFILLEPTTPALVRAAAEPPAA